MILSGVYQDLSWYIIFMLGKQFANRPCQCQLLFGDPFKKTWVGKKIRHSDIPDEVIEEYNIQGPAIQDGWKYTKYIQGMYGLLQSWFQWHDLLD
jgi:hypothetical protein